MRIAIAVVALVASAAIANAEGIQNGLTVTPDGISSHKTDPGQNLRDFAWQDLLDSIPGEIQLAQSQTCCKICRKGKACGNSCIAREKTCNKGPGCACDAN